MAFDLFTELTGLLAALDEHEINYALCGGLAMAVHGYPRATVDIDLMVLAEDVERAFAVAQGRGYAFRAAPMTFANGRVEIRRISKLDPDTHEPIPLDLVLVTPATRAAWDTRQQLQWEGGSLSVVSRDGLIALKKLRASKQDDADIEQLRKQDDG